MLLSERAVRASLRLGGWSGRQIDLEVTEETAARNKAEYNAGRFSKLLVNAQLLRPVNSSLSVTRQTHRMLTLPWDDDARILSTKGYDHYMNAMHTCRLSIEANVDVMLRLYPAYIHSQENKIRLGNMYNAADYPSPETLKKRYYFDCEIRPVEEKGDFRAELSNSSVKAIMTDIEQRQQKRLETAMNDIFERIHNLTGHMVEKLEAFKPAEEEGYAQNVFRDSLVDNIRETAELLPSLNITNDPRIEELRKQLMDHLVVEPEILRTNKKVRNDTRKKAEEVYKKVSKLLA